MYSRTIDIELPEGQSAFLWGARQTGKSTLLKNQFSDSLHFDLLNTETMLRFLSAPHTLSEELHKCSSEIRAKPIIIDEIQKIPALLDEVHRLIESERLSFVLCGSSARKLRRGGVNLLGGRAWKFSLHPLTWSEVPGFNLLTAMSTGLLPAFYGKKFARRSLKAYVEDYLTQEIFSEALVRNTASFARFFDTLAFCHGEMLNFSSIGRDSAIDSKTVRTYFEIMVDTLIGHWVDPFSKKADRRIVSSIPKFYLFDLGLANHIAGNSITGKLGANFGKSFEHFIFLELVAAESYQEWDTKIEYWRTRSGLEVDFVLDKGSVAIEVKSRLRSGDLRAIKAFEEEYQPRRSIVVTSEPFNRIADGIEVLNYEYFLDELGSGKLL